MRWESCMLGNREGRWKWERESWHAEKFFELHAILTGHLLKGPQKCWIEYVLWRNTHTHACTQTTFQLPCLSIHHRIGKTCTSPKDTHSWRTVQWCKVSWVFNLGGKKRIDGKTELIFLKNPMRCLGIIKIGLKNVGLNISSID